MKILHLVDTNGLGGAQRLLQEILNADTDKKHFVWPLRSVSNSLKFSSERAFENQRKSKNTLLIFRDLWQLQNREKFTHFHCHLPHAQLLGLLFSHLNKKVKIIFHDHADCLESGFLSRILHFIFWFSRNRISKIIVLNEHIATKLKSIFSEDKILLLPNACSKSDIEIQNESNFLRIGFVGRLVHRKGWKYFLELASNSELNAEFFLRGSGPDEGKVRNAIQEKKIENFYFEGFFEDIEFLYKNLDAIVICSAWEGSPMVKLEALMRGIPVISFPNIGLKDEPNFGVIFTKENTSQGLEKCLVQFAANMEHYRNEARKSRDFLLDRSMNWYLNRLDEVYKKHD